MRRFTILSIAAAFCFAAQVRALPPDVLWTQTFGGNSFETCSSVQQTADGGFILGGGTESFGAGDRDFYLVKTDASGVQQWAQTYGGTEGEYGRSVQQTNDGGYIFAGYTYSYGAGLSDVYVIKTDDQGVLEWDQTIGGNSFDACWSVQQTIDGGYILAGYTQSFGNGQSDMYLVKIDDQGNFDWQQTFGNGDIERCQSVQQTSDNGYILGGYRQTSQPFGFDIYVVKTDDMGNLDWEQDYDEGGFESCRSVVQTADGGYALAGYTTSFGEGAEDMHLVKLDELGDMEWQKSFGGASADAAYSLSLTSDGGFIIGGSNYSLGNGFGEMYLVKTNSKGDFEWQQSEGGDDFDFCLSTHQTSDGGFIAAGRSNSFGTGTGDMYLVRLDGFPFVTVTMTPENPPIIIPPGGSSFNFNIEVHNHELNSQTFDIWTDAVLPSGGTFGPIIGPVNLTMPGGQAADRDRSQTVPGSAPFGEYSYQAFVGEYPNYIWSSDSFPFSKPATATSGLAVTGWGNTGDDFGDFASEETVTSPSSFALLGAYPNPFNPATTISYALPQIELVSVKVYDVTGSLAATIVDGWRVAGIHEVTFDASSLPSGVYFAHFIAGDSQQTMRLLLVK
jgi:hypothetical protein